MENTVLEEKLEPFLSDVEGVGETEAMVSDDERKVGGF